MSRQREQERETKRGQYEAIRRVIACLEDALRWETLERAEHDALAEWAKAQRRLLDHHTKQPYKPWLSAELRRVGDEIDRFALAVCGLVDKTVELHKLRDAQVARQKSREAYKRERMEVARRLGGRRMR